MRNKKGFTLVELLAVIVILALIMGIAVISIGGVLNSARQSTFKETGVSIINGVRQQLTLANQLPAEGAKYYFFEERILEKGGDSPLGGSIQFVSGISGGKINISSTSTASEKTAEAIGNMGVYEYTDSGTPSCNQNTRSFVKVEKLSGNVYEYSICMTAGASQRYIEGKEEELLDSNNTAVIKP